MNMLSGSRLGASQVTAVVRRSEPIRADGQFYVVALRADLVWPFFVRLAEPVGVGNDDRRQAPRLAEQRRPLVWGSAPIA
jgi:hypothetical protein